LDFMRVASIVCGIFLAGCAVTNRYYLPTDPKLAHEGTVCGSVPWGSTRVPIGPDLSASVELYLRETSLGLKLQIALPKGTTVRFVEPEIGVASPKTGNQYGAKLDRFRLSVYGHNGQPGHREFFDANELLEGRGRNADLAGPNTQYLSRDLFVSGATFVVAPIDSLVLRFPAVEVNGVAFSSQSIPLGLVEKTGVMTCIQ